MTTRDKYKASISILLLLLLLTPIVVQLFHRHSHGHQECVSNLPAGLNHAHASKIHCKICSFEYITALIEVFEKQPVYRPEVNENMSLLHVATHSLNTVFSPLRAPPAII